MSCQLPSLIAGGDISPCRFVVPGAVAYTVVQATVLGQAAIGFSREFVYEAPTVNASLLAASAGRVVNVTRPSEVGEVEVGAAVLAWAYLRPDANGRAVTATAGQVYSAIALEAQATANNRVLAMPVERGMVVPT